MIKERKVPIRTIIILFFVVLILLFISVYTSLATFKKSYEQKNIVSIKVKDITPTITLLDNDINLNEGNKSFDLTILAGSKKFVNITLTNNESVNTKFKLYYTSNNILNDATVIGFSSRSETKANGLIGINETKKIRVGANNTTNSDITITIGIQSGYENNEVQLKEEKKEITNIIDEKLDEAILSDNSIQIQLPEFTSDSMDKGLFKMTDDIANETEPIYYYRGAVDNNYVSFGTHTSDVVNDIYDGSSTEEKKVASEGDPILWRIVRINSDGSIKLITENGIGDSIPNFNYETRNDIINMVNEWYTMTFTNNKPELDIIVKKTDLCIDNSATFHTRIHVYNPIPTLKCPDEENVIQTKAGLITADELVFAGILSISRSTNKNNLSYFYNGTNFWTITFTLKNLLPAICVYDQIYISAFYAAIGYARPTITIEADQIAISGDGTKDSPYELKVEEN